MGCGLSTSTADDEKDSKDFDVSRRNTLVQKPDVSVAIGSGVKKIDKERRIVFIFGKLNLIILLEYLRTVQFLNYFCNVALDVKTVSINVLVLVDLAKQF